MHDRLLFRRRWNINPSSSIFSGILRELKLYKIELCGVVSKCDTGLTVKRLERRLDCFRTGVGVLVVCGTSMRSSFWLVLGVDGTDDE